MPYLSLQSPGVSLKAACKIMLCLSQSGLQSMRSPVKHLASLFYTWYHTESAPGEQESSAMGHGVPRAASGDDGSRGFLGGMSCRQPSLAQEAHVGRCLWLCNTCTGGGGPLAQVVKAGCSTPLTYPWKFKTFVVSERSSSTMGTDGKEWAWPPKEDFLLAPLLLWSNRSRWISNPWKTACLVLQRVLRM